ncbi:hypothetical protein FHY52_36725, partial [Nocardia nova]|nr:hypothetical protein [Nocardia nova]
MSEKWRPAIGFAVVVVLLIAVVVLGWARPPRASVLGTDRLGPDSGERVADYLERAHESLSGADTAPRWALVTSDTGLNTDAVVDIGAGLRISQVLYHVPIDRVYTPVITVPVPAGTAALRS